MRAACFLDRDGVIVEEANYLAEPSDLVLLPNSGESIARLNRAGIPVVVITNQGGVARGLFPESRIGEIHAELDRLLVSFGARIERYYYCPHDAEAGKGRYKVRCECRKPEPGLFLKARDDLDLDLTASFMVGDRARDVEAGRRAGCRTILVRSGYGSQFDPNAAPESQPDFFAETLREAIDLCLSLLGDGHG